MATKKTYARCRNCGWHRDDGASLSKRGLCPECGHTLLSDAVDAMHLHRGPIFHRWRRGMAACVGVTLVDDSHPEA